MSAFQTSSAASSHAGRSLTSGSPSASIAIGGSGIGAYSIAGATGIAGTAVDAAAFPLVVLIGLFSPDAALLALDDALLELDFPLLPPEFFPEPMERVSTGAATGGGKVGKGVKRGIRLSAPVGFFMHSSSEAFKLFRKTA